MNQSLSVFGGFPDEWIHSVSCKITNKNCNQQPREPVSGQLPSSADNDRYLEALSCLIGPFTVSTKSKMKQKYQYCVVSTRPMKISEVVESKSVKFLTSITNARSNAWEKLEDRYCPRWLKIVVSDVTQTDTATRHFPSIVRTHLLVPSRNF